MKSIPQTFYVYVLARPNNKPFYIGKGKGSRVYDHDKEAKSGHKCYKCNVIRKIWRSGGNVQRFIVFTSENEQEAYDYERELIALHGRVNLTNLTDGGEGLRNPSAETREKLAQAMRGKSPINKGVPLSEERKKHLSEMNKGKKLAPHVREMLIKRNTGRKHSAERSDKVAFIQSGGKLYTAIAPDGTIYEHIKNLGRFGREHDLLAQEMRSVIQGKSTHCKGWVIWIEGQEPRPQPQTYVVIAPDGTRYEGILNVAAFAREHSINGHQLRAVLRGNRPHAQGWIGWETGHEPAVKPQPPVFTLIAPDGTQHHGVVNLRAFAQDHGIGATSLYRVVSGQYRQCKGWTGYKEGR